MKLQIHLLTRIAAAALICLMVTASLLIWRSDRRAQREAHDVLETSASQLESQLLKWGATLRLDNPFPDLSAWQPEFFGMGDCLIFESENRPPPRRFCNGASPAQVAPAMFEALYRAFFNPGKAVSRPVVFHKHRYGTLTVVPSAQRQLTEAWVETSTLLTFAVLMLGTVCALVYWSITRALAPSRQIVAGLEDLQRGNLGRRLPSFQLNEWRYIALAINQLASKQQQLLTERQQLAVKLMNLQEDERRDLARELHDEFGQCLTAINALSLSITLDGGEKSSAVAAEAGQIREICARMLDGIRSLLNRLRPVELDELGLEASLNSLVSGWNARHRGRTRYELDVAGPCADLPGSIALVLFRAAQECLTNVAKHAAATQVSVALTVAADTAHLRVRDDGRAAAIPTAFGVGLLGMRERAGNLRGGLELHIASPHGLIVDLRLPLGQTAGDTT